MTEGVRKPLYISGVEKDRVSQQQEKQKNHDLMQMKSMRYLQNCFQEECFSVFSMGSLAEPNTRRLLKLARAELQDQANTEALIKCRGRRVRVHQRRPKTSLQR